ncbi:hypothetical protein IQ266_12695 [filamentous cyanobacterium LEGE 11480]|uniref:Uncharacterized protein n=1 Tax=Romeriopsis navalis LEGE 11480 TaxID=2777977 RepID=A0A928Z3E3_9CYAN|nr:hypothetical protein [Romeriopsis navalis]MBE9030589.1 hypothetical protein [Romeriopsis navalis LEGE 11480]
MTTTIAADLAAEDYVVLGLATCFTKTDGEVQQLKVVEPIPSATLETLCQGIPTSYEMAIATTLGAIIKDGQTHMPSIFPAEAEVFDDFGDRISASARTYKRTRQAHVKDLMPLGTEKHDFNYSTERKRILNADRTVSADDNVKQHAHTHQVL